ncbi:hypothetical protein, conserved [Leishmania tarentolae]|uniref:Uncharacterized protein n=1 Tax=Leishmania tarentolae TaxID=5689 RepID=A0A640KCN1_LEITA|nr:hypothetical protein, conserved [Leishmania tarentolae]
MKRNGQASSSMPRSFDELKPTRSAAPINQRGSSVTFCGNEASPALPLVLSTDGGPNDGLLHGSDQTPCRATAAGSSIVANSTVPAATSSPTYARYAPHTLLPHGGGKRGPDVSGKSQEPSSPFFASSVSAGDGAQQSSPQRTVLSDHDDTHNPEGERLMSSLHHNTDVPDSALLPSAAAGARAADAVAQLLFPLKLPPASVTHLGAEQASSAGVRRSLDSLSESVNSAFSGSLLHGRNRIMGTGEVPASSEPISPLPIDEATGAGIGSEQHSRLHHPKHCLGEANAATTMPFLRDMEPLPVPQAGTRHRLPSGTHISRRPRSVVRRHTGAVGAGSATNGALSMMPGDVESASPMYGPLDGSVNSNALAASFIRQRGAASACVGRSASRSGAANRVGTGRTRDVLPQGTRSGTVARGAATANQRCRADPSPAPSRPPRSRKPRAGASPSIVSCSSSSPAMGGPTFSPSSPTQPVARVGHHPSAALQAQKRMLSGQSSPGASSPLTLSLERGSFFLAGDRDSLAASTNAVATHQHPTTTTSSYAGNRSGRSGLHNTGMHVPVASTKPPSGRRQGSLGRLLAPVQHSVNAPHVKEHGASSPLQDYEKLAATYLKLCEEVGDEPNMDWVTGLSLTKGGVRQLEMLPVPTTLNTADAKECSTNHCQRVSSALNSSLASSGHFLRSGPQQQQQHTPRGGVRPRIATGAASTSLFATMTAVEIPSPPSASFMSQRDSTPAGRRTKSLATRHATSSASSPSVLPKRSGSNSRITSVSRPSIFGSSTQQPQHTTTGGEGTPRTPGGSSSTLASSSMGVERTRAGGYAQQVAKYCAERLQPFVDNMKSVQEQRAAVTVALQSFMRVSRASLLVPEVSANDAASAEKSGGEEAGQPSVRSVRGQHHGGHSNRGLGSDRGGAMTSTTNSSTSTTPRKPNISRNSTASSLANTTRTGNVSRRASAAAAAAVKAASLSDALQTLQGAVITLLSTLSDSFALAQMSVNGALSPRTSADGVNVPLASKPAPMASATIPTLTPCTVFHSDESTTTRVDEATPAAAQAMLLESTMPVSLTGDPLPPLTHTFPGAEGMHTSQTEISALSSSAAVAVAVRVDPTVPAGTIPFRFMEFVRAQRREVSAQLDELCSAVRHALGSPVTTPEASTAQRPTVHRAGGPAATPLVRLEVSDMLSTPFFVPSKYLSSLSIAMEERNSDNAAAEKNAAVITGVDASVTSLAAGASLKSSNAFVFPKSTSSATGKKLKSSKLSSGGGGSMASSSSVNSTPRARANGMTMPYAPLFTFAIAADDDEVGDGGVEEGLQARSISARSTEGTGGNPCASVEWYLLCCVPPSTQAASTAAYSPRTGTASGYTSSHQNSTFNWSTTELSASTGSVPVGGAATENAKAKRTTGKIDSKRSASVGARKSGRTGGRGGGGSGMYQSRPALSASQKALTTATPAGSSKPPKNLSAGSSKQQGSAHKEKIEQMQLQRQLLKAWTLWTALQPLAENRSDAAGAGVDDPPAYLPQPSSASASVSTPALVHRNPCDCAPVEGNDTSTPPRTSTPTAAATSATAIASPTRKEAASVENSLSNSPPLTGTHHLLGSRNDDNHSHFQEHREDDGVPSGECSPMPVRSACSMPSVLSVQGVPRRLNMDDTALCTHSNGDSHHLLNARSSAEAFLYSTVEMPQHSAPPQSPASCVGDASSRSANTIAITRAATTDTRKAAAYKIAMWWTVLRSCRHAAAQRRTAHLMENATQLEKVLAARRDAFVRLWVCRWRLRKHMEARKQQQALASVTSTAARTAAEDGSAKTRRAAAKDNVAASTATTALSASRERFQRAKEQRKAALASAVAVTSGTAQPPPSASSSSSSSGSGAKDAASATAIRIPSLPLAASGISTFAIRDYHGESSSFTVSVMHRLLNAPPSLLYATCMMALRYPTNAPMAYLDNSGSAANHGLNGSEERQKSEAPPATGELYGGMAGSDQLQRWRRSWQSMRGSSAARQLSGHGCDDDDCSSGPLTAKQQRWIDTGLLYIRFLHLRHYVCSKYEVLILANARGGSSSLDATLNSATCSYHGSASSAVKTTVPVPPTMRYESIVDLNELQHAKPVVKPFHRPFEQWGMAYNLTSRVFCAAAIYAWQLIFSHTPFDDAKQRELPTREEQQARLERVEDRNCIILDCYGVRSEREWLREATKDLSFVGQVYLPNYDRDDPEQQRESRDNYDFVKNFLYQCFPSIDKLTDIPDYLVGAGLFFVLKEVFHYTKDSPSTQRMHEVLPRLVVMEGHDHMAAVTPATSALAGDSATAAPEESSVAAPMVQDGASRNATRWSPVPLPEAMHEGNGIKGLSGWQRAALQRYEQLRQLHHLSYGILAQEKSVGAVSSSTGSGGSQDKVTRPKQCQQQRRSRSPVAWSTSASGAAKDNAKTVGGDDGGDVTNSTSTKTAPDHAALTLRRCMANGWASSLTPMRATPESAAFSSTIFTSPAAFRDRMLEKSQSGAGERRASSSAIATPSRDASVQLVRVPHRLLRPSVADVQYVRDFEEEVSKSIRGIIRAWNGNAAGTWLDVFDLRAAMTADAALHDALDIAYPRHFLVKLSEMLSLELFGLQLSLGSCEDLDSMGQ